MYGENGQCECMSCQLARFIDVVSDLCKRVAAIEEQQSLDIAGDVGEDGTVKWRDGEAME